MARSSPIPNVLTIAGSDSGGGAGIQADLKAFSAHGTFGMSVITAITAQNTRAVTAIHDVPADVVRAQMDAVCSDIRVDAVKIGMLSSVPLIETIVEALDHWEPPIVVVDPVMVAKSGARLLRPEAVAVLREALIPRATLITPNLPEAADLLGVAEARSEDEMIAMLDPLRALGPAVLLKGGHLDGADSVDWLATAEHRERFAGARVHTKNTHGTGCSLSSAITARLAQGDSLSEAVRQARAWLAVAIARADELDVGRGHGPIHHFHGWWG